MRRVLIALIVLLGLAAADAAHAQVSRSRLAVRLNTAFTTNPNTGAVSIDTSGMGMASVDVRGTFSATLTFEVGTNEGNFETVDCFTPAAPGTAVNSTTAAGLWQCPVGGTRSFRVRVSSYTSGLAVVSLGASSGGMSTVASGGGGGGDVNLTQIGGTSVSVDAGNTGAGVLRVIEATDSGMAVGIGTTSDAAATAGSTGSLSAKARLMTSQLDSIKTAVETIDNAISGSGINISQIGGVAPAATACDDPSKVTGLDINNAAASGNTSIVAISGSTTIYVCGYALIADGAATDVSWVHGTGATCGTNEITKAFFPFDSTNGFGIAMPNAGASQFKTASGDRLCLKSSNAVSVRGTLSYVQQ